MKNTDKFPCGEDGKEPEKSRIQGREGMIESAGPKDRRESDQRTDGGLGSLLSQEGK